MKLLHLADVHLDRPFVGLTHAEATVRRRDVFDAFRRCLAAAVEHDVDAITIGGDLWEDEHVTVNTRRAVAHELRQLGIPVLIVTGNHDPLLGGGAYARTEWSNNVHVFGTEGITEKTVGTLSVWGISWGASALSSSFLQAPIGLDSSRVNLLLLHGTATPVAFFAEDAAYCPFAPGDVRAAGFARCLAGHIHAGSDDGTVAYPGSPEPLDWSETGQHAYLLVDVEGHNVTVTPYAVNTRSYLESIVDCTGAASSSEIEQRVERQVEVDPNLCLSVRLVGAVVPGCRVSTDALAARLRPSLAAIRVADLTFDDVNIDEIVARASVDGAFARRIQLRLLDAEARQDELEMQRLKLALALGVGAMQGRSDLVDLDL